MTADPATAAELLALAQDVITVGCPCDLYENDEAGCGHDDCPYCGDRSLIREARRLVGRAILGEG
jgi:hypothetical protein